MVDHAVTAPNKVMSPDDLTQSAEACRDSYHGVIQYLDEQLGVLGIERDVRKVCHNILPGILSTLRDMRWLERYIQNDLIQLFLALALGRFIVYKKSNWRGEKTEDAFEKCVIYDGWMLSDNKDSLSQTLYDAKDQGDSYNVFRSAMSKRYKKFLVSHDHDSVFCEVFEAYNNILIMIADFFENEKQDLFERFYNSLFTWKNYKQRGVFLQIMIHDLNDDVGKKLQERRNKKQKF